MDSRDESSDFRHAKSEIEEGRKLGAELFKQVQAGTLSRDEYISKMFQLSPMRRAGAEEVISALIRVGEALGRIAEGTATLDLDLQPDATGYYDRRCPAADCRAYFKVHYDDWRSKDFSEVRCPVCGHRADHNEFDTPTQREHVEFRGQTLVEQEITRSLPGIAFEVTAHDRPVPRDIAIKIEEVLERATQCEQCACRYAALTHPFFCPACGHRSSPSAFRAELEAVEHALQSIPNIRVELARTVGQQAAENLIQRALLEANFMSLVGAFQSAAEARFQNLPNPAGLGARKNLFQNLKESSELWQRVTGRDFASMLSTDEWQDIQRLFQQRHKLAHTGGIVDQDYRTKTGDTRYAVGDRVAINEGTVRRLAFLVSKLVGELQK